jgi:hypothetical protein
MENSTSTGTSNKNNTGMENFIGTMLVPGLPGTYAN